MRWIIFLAFVLYTFAETALLVDVCHWIGIGWVMTWEVGTILLGLILLRTYVIKYLRFVAQKLREEIVPTHELVDLLLVLAGALLLISPGLLADLLGFYLVFPLTRVWTRRLLLHWLQYWMNFETPV
jgi:UPF0716 protein FxsA